MRRPHPAKDPDETSVSKGILETTQGPPCPIAYPTLRSAKTYHDRQREERIRLDVGVERVRARVRGRRPQECRAVAAVSRNTERGAAVGARGRRAQAACTVAGQARRGRVHLRAAAASRRRRRLADSHHAHNVRCRGSQEFNRQPAINLDRLIEARFQPIFTQPRARPDHNARIGLRRTDAS